MASGESFYSYLDKSQKDPDFQAKVMEVLKEAKANPSLMKTLVEYRTYWGHTTLMQACSAKNVEVVEALVAAGADVNASSEEGEQVLNWALIGDECKDPNSPLGQIIKLLLEHGAGVGPGYGSEPERLKPYRV